MILLLTLFFASLLGIGIMIGRKLILLKQAGGMMEQMENEIVSEIPDFEEIKYVTLKKLKKYSFVALVLTIRIYVKSSNFLKKQSKDMGRKIKAKLRKEGTLDPLPEKQEVSGFLKMISEYKRKVKRIKRKIKEEEKED